MTIYICSYEGYRKNEYINIHEEEGKLFHSPEGLLVTIGGLSGLLGLSEEGYQGYQGY